MVNNSSLRMQIGAAAERSVRFTPAVLRGSQWTMANHATTSVSRKHNLTLAPEHHPLTIQYFRGVGGWGTQRTSLVLVDTSVREQVAGFGMRRRSEKLKDESVT